MHGNQWVLKIAVLKYYSVSKRGTTAKSNPKQATDPISLHTKFGDNSSNTFPLNERKPCVTPDIGRRTSDGEKSKNNISTPQGGGHNNLRIKKKLIASNLHYTGRFKDCCSLLLVKNFTPTYKNHCYTFISHRIADIDT